MNLKLWIFTVGACLPFHNLQDYVHYFIANFLTFDIIGEYYFGASFWIS